MKKIRFSVAIFACAAGCLLSGVASAVTLNPESITRYSPYLSANYPANGYPNQALVGDRYRHVMVFDLSGVTEQIIGATLEIVSGYGTHVTVSTSRTYSVWDVTSPINDIARRIQGGPAQSYYDDIGSGILYGSTTVPVTPTNGANPLPSPGVIVELDGGLTDLNAARGAKIAFGGKSPQTFNMFFGASDLSGITLTLNTVVPIPPAVWLFGSGLIGLVGIARRKKAA